MLGPGALASSVTGPEVETAFLRASRRTWVERPRSALRAVMLASVAARSGDLPAALEHLDEAVRRHSTLVFAALSYGAALRKSPTYDEPHHLLGGYLASRQDDYRFDVEHPALFRRLAALTVPANALRVPFPDRDQHKRVPMLHNPALSEEQLYREFPDVDAFRWAMVMRTLFQTEGVDPEALIDRARLPFALLGASLVALIAWWAWRLAGGTAAVAAAVLLAFDPTFLGHSALVKNDAPIAALMTAVMFAAWCVGRRATVVNATALVVAFAAALNMKNSGVLLAPFLALAFLIRALMPLDWPAFGKVLAKRRQRFVLEVGSPRGRRTQYARRHRWRRHPNPGPSRRLAADPAPRAPPAPAAGRPSARWHPCST
jgi:hypothetical protein